jgi:hypothetical protein
VRALLESEQQASFDANVRAGATAEVDMNDHSARARGQADADASVRAGSSQAPHSEGEHEPTRPERPSQHR